MEATVSLKERYTSEVSTLLEGGYLSPKEVFILGLATAKNSVKLLKSVGHILEQLFVLRLVYFASKETVEGVYCLMLGEDWSGAENAVCRAVKMVSADSGSGELLGNEQSCARMLHAQLQKVIQAYEKIMDSTNSVKPEFIASKQQRDDLSTLEKRTEMQLDEDTKEVQNKPEVKANCPICLLDISRSDFRPLLRCGHTFHRHCISASLIKKVKARSLPLSCPICRAELRTLDIRTYLPPDVQGELDHYSLLSVLGTYEEEYLVCPTPKCYCVMSASAAHFAGSFTCQKCRVSYCLNCNCVYHANLTCEEFQVLNTFGEEDKKCLEAFKKEKYRQCAECYFWVEKRGGSEQVKCRCGREFCYTCGGDYPNCYCKAGKVPPEAYVYRPVPSLNFRPHLAQ